MANVGVLIDEGEDEDVYTPEDRALYADRRAAPPQVRFNPIAFASAFLSQGDPSQAPDFKSHIDHGFDHAPHNEKSSLEIRVGVTTTLVAGRGPCTEFHRLGPGMTQR